MSSASRHSNYLAAVGRAIDHVESSLSQPQDLDSIAGAARLSRYYFSRIFQAMVGEPVFDYIRKRRLAEIAHRLVATRTPIVDLAFDWGYESQQSMTKAFRAQYGVTPARYRREGRDRYFFHRPRISYDSVAALHRDLRLRPHVFTLPALRLTGLSRSLPIQTPEAVERTRAEFRERSDEIRGPARYRGIFEVTLMRQEQLVGYSPDQTFDGFIGVATNAATHQPDAADSDWETIDYPAGRYLSFCYTGDSSIMRLSAMYRYIFSTGLATRQEPLADRDFFHYYRPGHQMVMVFLPLADDGCW